jgi:hypothetical protein
MIGCTPYNRMTLKKGGRALVPAHRGHPLWLAIIIHFACLFIFKPPGHQKKRKKEVNGCLWL